MTDLELAREECKSIILDTAKHGELMPLLQWFMMEIMQAEYQHACNKLAQS